MATGPAHPGECGSAPQPASELAEPIGGDGTDGRGTCALSKTTTPCRGRLCGVEWPMYDTLS